MRKVTILLVGFFLGVGSAFALSLDEAKAKGLVGETPNGYLAAVSGASAPEVRGLLADINAKRKDAYKDIAQKNGSPLELVEKIGGREAIAKAPPGTMIQDANGGWSKK